MQKSKNSTKKKKKPIHPVIPNTKLHFPKANYIRCSHYFCHCCNKDRDRSFLIRKDFFILTTPKHSPLLREAKAGTEGGIPEAGTEVESWGGLFAICLSSFHTWPRDLPVWSSTIIHLENAPQTRPWVNLIEIRGQLRLSPPRLL